MDEEEREGGREEGMKYEYLNFQFAATNNSKPEEMKIWGKKVSTEPVLGNGSMTQCSTQTKLLRVNQNGYYFIIITVYFFRLVKTDYNEERTELTV